MSGKGETFHSLHIRALTSNSHNLGVKESLPVNPSVWYTVALYKQRA
jgi:hypothetical protein